MFTLLALAPTAAIVTRQPDALVWPDTPQARAARAFVATLNDPSAERVRQFEETFRARAQLQAVPIPVRAARMADLSARVAPVRVERLDASGSTLRMQVRAADGTPIVMAIVPDPRDEERIDGITLEIGGQLEDSHALSLDEIGSLVEGTAAAIRDGYVFPEKGAAMAELLLHRQAEGHYDGLNSDVDLARALQEDLRSVTNDRHISVRPMPRSAAQPQSMIPPADNAAFREVQVLPGNIGYLRFDLFVPGPEAERTAAAAMEFLRDCDAIIYDLRRNGGGSPEMIRFLTSYLFDGPTHLNDMVNRDGEVVEEYWTLESVPGDRLGQERPAFVLTSSYTFSGAEEFSYNLKNLGRATIIGEQTGGGAHPVRGEPIAGTLVVGVPYMRARNPISMTNWEGVGVEPDVAVPADEALDRARELALESVRARSAR
ncbi:MAG: S41 family peptidase [Phycisphaeraceae bacterium]|nr:S41 family peptidase [Phycisphaeraceae bacterium]